MTEEQKTLIDRVDAFVRIAEARKGNEDDVEEARWFNEKLKESFVDWEAYSHYASLDTALHLAWLESKQHVGFEQRIGWKRAMDILRYAGDVLEPAPIFLD